jgi:sugar lactone lactonase YvrE
MNNPATSRRLLTRIVLGILAASVCAGPARGQYVSTVLTNLSQPAGVAVDSNNDVYITDPGNYRIAKYVPSSGTLTTLAGSGTLGAGSGTGAAASFFIPQGIVAARGGLIVADEGSQLIRYVSFQGMVSNLAGQPFVSGAIDAQGTNATFSYPTGIAVDSASNLYVADSQNGVIREIDNNNNVSTVPTGGYTFNLPNAVAVDNNTNIWVTDSGHEVICMISNGTVTVVAGVFGQAGTNDSLTATNARFSSPSGLLWLANQNGLYVSDTGNDTIRSLFLTNFNGSITYAVQTIAGLAGLPGLVNGALSAAQFDSPIGLCVDPTDLGFYVADSANGALRVLQATAPLPPITAPEIGFLSFPLVGGSPYATFNDITGSSVVFNNTNFIAIQADPTTETFMSYGATGSGVPLPGPDTGSSPRIYTPADNGLPPWQVPPTVVPPAPDITLYAISEATGRPSSPVVSARIQYVTATPNIVGDDCASVLLTDATTNAQLWYTFDGSVPVQYGTNSTGPVTGGSVISFAVYTNTVLSVKAFYPGFADSSVATNLFTPQNFIADKLTFGFQAGEASSAFIAAAGQRFYAPVTLTLIPTGETMYTLQFDLVVSNLTGPPLAQSGTFQSMLVKPLPGAPIPVYVPIPPAMFTGTGFQSLLVTNTALGLLGVGWLERPPETNLYNTTAQTLISFSLAHDTLFLSSGGEVIVGGFSFYVPPKATNGQTYLLDASNPSATSDGITTPVIIQVVTNGSLTNGPINSVKIVTVGSFQYLVGDAAPFRWFNAGDFGDGVLLNDDVTEVFQSAVYGLNTPPLGSDFFDVMDSCNGNTNNLYNANDTTINTISMGDGVLNVDDVYVTFRRSLDPSLTNYARFWSNGVRQAVAVPSTAQPTSVKSSAPSPGKMDLPSPRYVTVAADQVQTGGNLTVQVPIRVLAADTMPIRVAMLNVEVDPLDGSPAITNAPAFAAVTNLGSPAMTSSLSVNNFAAAWLDAAVAGVSGTNIIGTLTVTLPPNVNANSAYLVHFDHFSASPNGLALFHATVQDGLITVGNRTGSSWHDGIPDTWRLLYFGTVSNALSAANADPDGDGASNWDEFIAGTNPLDATSVFKFLPGVAPAAGGFTLQWPSVVNKIYTVQSSASPAWGWTTVASNLIGNSQTLQWTDTNASGQARFYRALVQ